MAVIEASENRTINAIIEITAIKENRDPPTVAAMYEKNVGNISTMVERRFPPSRYLLVGLIRFVAAFRVPRSKHVLAKAHT
jgi:hypothetical protein